MERVHAEIAKHDDLTRARELCAFARKLVQETAQAARALSLELHPGILDDLGLVPALRWYCSEIQKKSGLQVTLRAPARVEADPEVARTLYRAAQESLQNVAEHANASKAIVSLVQSVGSLSLRVEDDGSGFEPGTPSQGIGLLRVRERAAHLGGELRVESGADGTVIELLIPTASSA